MSMFKAEIEDDRALIFPWLAEIIGEAWDLAGVKVTANSKCFQDARVWSEMLKFGIQQGPISLQTFNEETGRDDEEETRRKKAELGQKDTRLPLFDAAHGKRPAAETGGRPVGTADPPPA